MRYWHEVPLNEQNAIMDKGGMTWSEFGQQFKQPDWCGYTDALYGVMGCWSLMIRGTIKSIEDCKECDARKGASNDLPGM